MTTLKYCLDANVFIEPPKRYYTFDIAPPYWQALIEWGIQGTICSARRVLRELNEKNDDLSLWAKTDAIGLFLEPDDITYACYSEVADFVEINYEEQHKQEFLDGADPWVIAQSMAHELTVVTLETWKTVDRNGVTKKIKGKVKIPNICAEFKVRYIDIPTFLREMKFKFQ